MWKPGDWCYVQDQLTVTRRKDRTWSVFEVVDVEKTGNLWLRAISAPHFMKEVYCSQSVRPQHVKRIQKFSAYKRGLVKP